jgi:ABC-type Fe3+ transport system permease subunit
MNVSSTIKRTIAATEVLLIFPAVLFMTGLFVRNVQPQQYEPAATAQRIVMWYAGRQWTLWVLLIALPFAVLVTGGVTLLRSWNEDAELRAATRQTLAAIRTHLATAIVALATVIAGGILAVIAVHVMTD